MTNRHWTYRKSEVKPNLPHYFVGYYVLVNTPTIQKKKIAVILWLSFIQIINEKERKGEREGSD